MKTVSKLFGDTITIAENAQELETINKARGGNSQGLPANDCYVMPLIGESNAKIKDRNGVEQPQKWTTVCVAYKDKADAWQFRMVSKNSFGRTAKESPESPTANVKIVKTDIEEPIFTLKASDVIKELKNQKVVKLETKPLCFPNYFDNGTAVYEAPFVIRDTVMRETQADETGYKEARKAFDTMVKAEKLEAAVKAVEAA